MGDSRPPYGSARFARSVKFSMVVQGTAVPCTPLITTLPPRFRLRRTAYKADARLRAPCRFACRPYGPAVLQDCKSVRYKRLRRLVLAPYMPPLRIIAEGVTLSSQWSFRSLSCPVLPCSLGLRLAFVFDEQPTGLTLSSGPLHSPRASSPALQSHRPSGSAFGLIRRMNRRTPGFRAVKDSLVRLWPARLNSYNKIKKSDPGRRHAARGPIFCPFPVKKGMFFRFSFMAVPFRQRQEILYPGTHG